MVIIRKLTRLGHCLRGAVPAPKNLQPAGKLAQAGLLGRIPAGDSMEHLVRPERKEESWWLAGNTTLPPAACDVKCSHAY